VFQFHTICSLIGFNWPDFQPKSLQIHRNKVKKQHFSVLPHHKRCRQKKKKKWHSWPAGKEHLGGFSFAASQLQTCRQTYRRSQTDPACGVSSASYLCKRLHDWGRGARGLTGEVQGIKDDTHTGAGEDLPPRQMKRRWRWRSLDMVRKDWRRSVNQWPASDSWLRERSKSGLRGERPLAFTARGRGGGADRDHVTHIANRAPSWAKGN